ncbi:predicted protein [Botrytis cinerea T4]|uniref:Uncharacterized protein n=1 Tax=Botryotinia fuckeliana (strain T4) TaxID=999810 RepID=G2Y9M4_BOTF4|nr:predicted protein [Botrytis cinerea T4]
MSLKSWCIIGTRFKLNMNLSIRTASIHPLPDELRVCSHHSHTSMHGSRCPSGVPHTRSLLARGLKDLIKWVRMQRQLEDEYITP